MRTIKRYANRKLYDTTDSAYVTLADIAKFVRAGEEVNVVDNKTQKDITGVTFALVVAAELSGGGLNTNVDELRAIIAGGVQLTVKVPEPAVLTQEVVEDAAKRARLQGAPLDFGK